MFFTRTIRRKLITGLSVILAVLVILVLSGIPSLDSYHNTLKNLHESVKEIPQRSSLNKSVALLFKPLLMQIPDSEKAMRYQREDFSISLQEVHASLKKFREQYDALPQSPENQNRKRFVASQLYEVDQHLAHLKHLQASLDQPEKRLLAMSQMLVEIGKLEVLIQQIPDSQVSLNQVLERADKAYHVRFLWVSGVSAVGVILFIILARYSYTHIYCPFKELHSGACRVAQGEFEYELNIGSRNDEMSELADAFNMMTARFQEIRENLDQQVRDRFQQLVRSERLAGIGFLSAGVAHEINNPLSAISMASESILNSLDNGTKQPSAEDCELMQEYMKMIQTESDRCVKITRKLLEFARGGTEDERREVDLHLIVKEVLSMVSHMKQYGDREIVFDHQSTCFIEANRAEIKQVVLNLIANALEAMEGGKQLTIDIVEQIDSITITFEDEGCGMSSEVLEHLFDPFFTQRKSGKGTGLGMSISNRIISDHGGILEATSLGIGQGSTMTIQLPKNGKKIQNAA